MSSDRFNFSVLEHCMIHLETQQVTLTTGVTVFTGNNASLFNITRSEPC